MNQYSKEMKKSKKKKKKIRVGVKDWSRKRDWGLKKVQKSLLQALDVNWSRVSFFKSMYVHMSKRGASWKVNYAAGKVKSISNKKSAPLPKNDNSPVKTVVYSNFNKVCILRHTKSWRCAY